MKILVVHKEDEHERATTWLLKRVGRLKWKLVMHGRWTLDMNELSKR